MNAYTLHGVITALSPISHNSDTRAGNSTLLRRQYVMRTDGTSVEVPYISGNAIRGYLRRLAMKDLLVGIGYTVDLATPGGKRLWHAMFSGGLLSKDAKVGIDLALKRNAYTTIPTVRLFGWAWGNQMIESKMKVGHAVLRCRDLHDTPVESEGNLPAIRDCIEQTFHTRRHDRAAEYNDDPTHTTLAKTEDDERNQEPHQMICAAEVFRTGVRFGHEFVLEDPTDLEVSALAHMIGLWRGSPYVGGKSAIGLGRVDLSYGDLDSSIYQQYIREHADDIRAVLDELVIKS